MVPKLLCFVGSLTHLTHLKVSNCCNDHLLGKSNCGMYYKCFSIVIYNHNDIGLYYKTRDDHN